MTRGSRYFAMIFVLLLMSVGAIAKAQDASAPKSASEVVNAHTYVSLEPVPRGKEFEAAVVVQIADGYHMNSHKPLDSYLIPTTLTPQLPAGIHLVDTIYPAGRQKKFAFSPDKPLDVYSGSVTLRMKLTAQESAALGDITIPITLRYQACNNSACLPPVKVPVNAELKVAAAGTTAKAVHSDIFAASAQSK
jgi:thioredoxin:protein disulfide reductase